jgi:hypothetical protein
MLVEILQPANGICCSAWISFWHFCTVWPDYGPSVAGPSLAAAWRVLVLARPHLVFERTR